MPQVRQYWKVIPGPLLQFHLIACYFFARLAPSVTHAATSAKTLTFQAGYREGVSAIAALVSMAHGQCLKSAMFLRTAY